jgi:hypothetical protein
MATSFTVLSDTQIMAVAPAGPQNTTVDVTVTTPAGTSANFAADRYTFDPPASTTTSGDRDRDHDLDHALHHNQHRRDRDFLQGQHQGHQDSIRENHDKAGEKRESSDGDSARMADLDAFFASDLAH